MMIVSLTYPPLKRLFLRGLLKGSTYLVSSVLVWLTSPSSMRGQRFDMGKGKGECVKALRGYEELIRLVAKCP